MEPHPPPLDSDPAAVIADMLPCQWVRDGGAVLATGTLLTARDVDVLAAVSHGLSNREMAAQPHLAESTVRSNVSQVCQKLDLNRIQLALLWLQMRRTAQRDRPTPRHRTAAG